MCSDIIPRIISRAHKSFSTGLTDIWSLALSYHLFPGTSLSNFFSSDSPHGSGTLYSSIRSTSSFSSHILPFPITVIDSRPPGFENLPPGTNLPLNATVYEATPFEFGSYDPDLQAFIDMQHLGTKLTNLQPASNTSCVSNFDQAGFIVGTSSSLFFVSMQSIYGIWVLMNRDRNYSLMTVRSWRDLRLDLHNSCLRRSNRSSWMYLQTQKMLVWFQTYVHVPFHI